MTATPQPALLTMTAADVLDSDEKALVYLSSLAVRTATGEVTASFQAELEIVAREAFADPSLGDTADGSARSLDRITRVPASAWETGTGILF